MAGLSQSAQELSVGKGAFELGFHAHIYARGPKKRAFGEQAQFAQASLLGRINVLAPGVDLTIHRVHLCAQDGGRNEQGTRLLLGEPRRGT